MAVNWAQRQIERYAHEGERLLRRLQDGENDGFFLQCTINFLRTYLEIPSQERTERRGDEIMVRLALFLRPAIHAQGKRDTLDYLWPQVLVIAEQVADPNVKALITEYIAISYSNRGQVGEAISRREAILASEYFGRLEPGIQASILHQNGLCCLYQGNYAKALENFLRSLDVADTPLPSTSIDEADEEKDSILPFIRAVLPVWPSKLFSLNHLGNIALYCGDDRKAQSYYEQSLALLRANGAENTYACVPYQSLGRLYLLRRQFADVIPMTERAIANLHRLREPLHIATNWTYLAAAYLGLGRDAEAEDLLTTALQTCRKLDDPVGCALCHFYFGHLESIRRNDAAAIVQWQQALDLLSSGTMMAIELQVLVNLLPKLLAAGQYRSFGRTCLRLLANLHRQQLGPVSFWRVLRLYTLPPAHSRPVDDAQSEWP